MLNLKTHLKQVVPHRTRRVIKRALGITPAPADRKARAFYDLAEFPFLQALESEWRAVRAELDALDAGSFVTWPSDDARGSWTAFGLYAMKRKIGEYCERCPETTRLIEGIPELVTAGFSALGPGTRILPHRDVSNTTLRCHLGLVVPAGCRMRLGSVMCGWQEGRCMVFDSSFEHEVWHDGASTRIVLLIDFLKPGMAYDHGFSRAGRKLIPDTATVPEHGA